MPTYSYLNKETDERVDLIMSMAEMDAFERDNPHMQRLYEQMNIVDPVAIGVTKPPSEFTRDVLGRVANMPGADKSKIYKRWQPSKIV